jgi:nitrous oxidase accessory protein NosD
MSRILSALAVSAVLLLGACSVNQATSNVGNMDGPAVQACGALKAVIQARAAGGLAPTELRAQLGNVYSLAANSANPIIKARALALFADATAIASGDEGQSLNSDLSAMDQACSGGGG